MNKLVEKYEQLGRVYFNHEELPSRLTSDSLPSCDWVEILDNNVCEVYQQKGIEAPIEIADFKLIFDQGGYLYALDETEQSCPVYFAEYNGGDDWGVCKVYNTFGEFIKILDSVQVNVSSRDSDDSLYQVKFDDTEAKKKLPKYWDELLSGNGIMVHGLCGLLLVFRFDGVKFLGGAPRYSFDELERLESKVVTQLLSKVRSASNAALKEAMELKKLSKQFSKPMPKHEELVCNQGFESPENGMMDYFLNPSAYQ